MRLAGRKTPHTGQGSFGPRGRLNRPGGGLWRSGPVHRRHGVPPSDANSGNGDESLRPDIRAPRPFAALLAAAAGWASKVQRRLGTALDGRMSIAPADWGGRPFSSEQARLIYSAAGGIWLRASAIFRAVWLGSMAQFAFSGFALRWLAGKLSQLLPQAHPAVAGFPTIGRSLSVAPSPVRNPLQKHMLTLAAPHQVSVESQRRIVTAARIHRESVYARPSRNSHAWLLLLPALVVLVGGLMYSGRGVLSSIQDVDLDPILDKVLDRSSIVSSETGPAASRVEEVKTKMDRMLPFMLEQTTDLPRLAAVYDPASLLENKSDWLFVAPSARILGRYEDRNGMRVGLVGSADPAQRGWRIVIHPDAFLRDTLSPEEASIILYAHNLMLQDARSMTPGDFFDKEIDVVAWAWTRTLANVYEPLRGQIQAPEVESIYQGYVDCQQLWRPDDASQFQKCWTGFHQLRMRS